MLQVTCKNIVSNSRKAHYTFKNEIIARKTVFPIIEVFTKIRIAINTKTLLHHLLMALKHCKSW